MPEARILWEPSPERKEAANITAFSSWLAERGREFRGYPEMWSWSVAELDEFWRSIWEYYGVGDLGEGGRALGKRTMPGAEWFPGARLNYAKRVFAAKNEGAALVCRSEGGARKEVSWADLERATANLSETLRTAGVRSGDRVASYLPNGPEAAVGLLASASLGAVWSSCSPDFGVPSVVDRFSQIAPKVLIAAGGYDYGGKHFDRGEAAARIASSIPSIKETIGVGGVGGELDWEEAVSGRSKLRFEGVPFGHPLWILYSSGTTGLPKPIVHGHGGILLEHLKELGLHNDAKMGGRFFWFTTTGWMMWNYLVGALLHGATAVLYDGSPGHPSMNALWDIVEEEKVGFFGASAPYVAACEKARITPRTTHDLSRLAGFGSTGSPLSRESFAWLYRSVKEDLWVDSLSGGTDVCTAFVGGCPTLPVRSGEIQCVCLGAKVEAFDDAGRSVVGRVGELVVTEPMPSMPLYLWGDEDGTRYAESYFSMYPGVWRHGDWIKITRKGGCVIYGRSDATIKRMGVRIGTSEIYRSVESLDEVADSLAVEVDGPGGRSKMVLFVVPAHGLPVDESLKRVITRKVRQDISPRYVPDEIVEVPAIPKTLNGKKMEVPVKKILMGVEPGKALNQGSVANPQALLAVLSASKRLRESWKL